MDEQFAPFVAQFYSVNGVTLGPVDFNITPIIINTFKWMNESVIALIPTVALVEIKFTYVVKKFAQFCFGGNDLYIY